MADERNWPTPSSGASTDEIVDWLLAQSPPVQREWLRSHYPAEIAELLDSLDSEEERSTLFSLIIPDLEMAAEVLAESEADVSSELLAAMPEATVSDLLEEMEADDAADVLAEMREEDSQRAARVLAGMDPEDAHDVRALLAYPEDSAGGIMSPDFVALTLDMTADQAIQTIRRQVHESEFFYVFVVDKEGKFLGTVSMHRLISARPEARLENLFSDVHQIYVNVDDDQEKVARTMRTYNVVSLPVLDAEGRVVGRITHDDIMDVVEEESSEDFLRMAGTGVDELTSRSVFEVARLRSPALLISLLAGFFMCTVVAGFEENLNILFVAFMPLIPLMSGNTGNQASTVLIRGLATGQVRREQFLRYIFREVRVGILIGLAFAAITFTVVHLVFRRHDPLEVSLAVGLAVFAAVTFANLIGAVIPFALTRLGLDPAIASGPVLTAITDTSSLAIYLTIAMVAAAMAGLGGIHPGVAAGAP